MNTSKDAQIVGSKQSRTSRWAHRVEVTEDPPSPGALPDYADAFAIELSKSDNRPAERCARDGFERLPLVARQPALLAHR